MPVKVRDREIGRALDKSLEALGNVAQHIGVWGAVLLVISLGVALRVGTIIKACGEAWKHWLDYRLKDKQVSAMISRETERMRGKLSAQKTTVSAKDRASKSEGTK